MACLKDSKKAGEGPDDCRLHSGISLGTRTEGITGNEEVKKPQRKQPQHQSKRGKMSMTTPERAVQGTFTSPQEN